MSLNIHQHPLEPKVEKMISGFREVATPVARFTLDSGELSSSKLIEKGEQMLALFVQLRHTKAEHEAAVKACQRALPAMQSLHEQGMAVAQQHYDSDAEKMSRFGACRSRKPQKRRGSCKGEVIEEVTTTVIEQVTEVEATASCGCQHPGCGCAPSKPPRDTQKPGCAKPKPPRGRSGEGARGGAMSGGWEA